MKIAMAAVVFAATAFLAFACAQSIFSSVPSNTNHTWGYLSTNRPSDITASLPIIYPSQRAKAHNPGVYLSKPYTIVIVNPISTGDNCVLGSTNDFAQNMPIYNPGVTLVPVSETKK
ncbi:MAG TPA: hypothetical protein VGN23_07710 [Verrucomicrobiae bacterium]|jgi:hypothetical protein